MFNPHGNVTADGVLIVEGLRVFTNEMEVGTVVSGEPSTCCMNDLSEEDKAKHPEGNAQVRIGTGWFSDHEAGAHWVAGGCYCRHDHWFKVQTETSLKSFNGERIATRFEGRRA